LDKKSKKAKKQIADKEFKYISPVLNRSTKNAETGVDIGWSLHSVALTNTPFFEELGEISAQKEITRKKETKVSEKKDIEELKKQNKILEDKLQKQADLQVEKNIDDAISANKITKEQKESLLKMGKKNPDSLKKFLDSAKTANTKPEDNLFSASTNKDGDIDLLVLAGIGGSDDWL
jgi:phage I-like protein